MLDMDSTLLLTLKDASTSYFVAKIVPEHELMRQRRR
jgi:hypothetical protein